MHRLLERGYSPAATGPAWPARLRDLGAVVKLVDDARIPMDNYYTNGRFSFIRIETAAEYGPEVLELLTERHPARHLRRRRLSTGCATSGSTELERQRGQRPQHRQRHAGRGPVRGPPPGAAARRRPPSRWQDWISTRCGRSTAGPSAPENLIFSVVGPLTHEELKTSLEDQLAGQRQADRGPARRCR